MREIDNWSHIGITEDEFENEINHATYLYNQINVFVNSYDIEEELVELKSCDERLLEGNELSVVIPITDFIQNYM